MDSSNDQRKNQGICVWGGHDIMISQQRRQMKDWRWVNLIRRDSKNRLNLPSSWAHFGIIWQGPTQQLIETWSAAPPRILDPFEVGWNFTPVTLSHQRFFTHFSPGASSVGMGFCSITTWNHVISPRFSIRKIFHKINSTTNRSNHITHPIHWTTPRVLFWQPKKYSQLKTKTSNPILDHVFTKIPTVFPHSKKHHKTSWPLPRGPPPLHWMWIFRCWPLPC